MEKTLETDRNIECIRGIGKSRRELLGRLSLKTLGDVLLNLPRRFLDRRNLTPVSELRPGMEAVVSGRIAAVSRRRGRRGPSVTALFSDDTGSMKLTFFRSGYPASSLREGMQVIACGTVEEYRGYNMVHPELYFSSDASEAAEAPGMLPVYGLTSGLTQAVMRKLADSVLQEVRGSLSEILPQEVITGEGFASRWDMFRAAHRPGSPEEAATARDLVALEELFLHRSILQAVREKGKTIPGIPLSSLEPSEFQRKLPWPLTGAQKRVCEQVRGDLSGGRPMRRLIQGDVGSGKTVVAAYGCVSAVLSGRTAAILAPTEVLASQHYVSMKKFCEPFGVKVSILTGGTPAGERKLIGQSLASSPDSLLVGTHAILEDWVPLDSLGFLVIDEQHRFGVAQREKLLAGRDPRPHVMIMSATPIPRTLAMTFYGDLDLSVIDEMPPGRGPTATSIVAGEDKGKVFRFMLGRLEKGERVFMVYPLKEASEKSDLRDAATAFDIVASGPMAVYGAGLLHGSMPPSEKLEVTGKFSRGEIGVLVSTTVIEVGIDVPEATVMVIVNADRFGLSQLHQLRGRVGRGGGESWCFLVPGEEVSREAMQRLETLAATSDGFAVAGKDLEARGPGQVLGTAQHGIPEFRVADLASDGHLVEKVNSLKPLPLELVHRMIGHQMWRYGDMELPGV